MRSLRWVYEFTILHPLKINMKNVKNHSFPFRNIIWTPSTSHSCVFFPCEKILRDQLTWHRWQESWNPTWVDVFQPIEKMGANMNQPSPCDRLPSRVIFSGLGWGLWEVTPCELSWVKRQSCDHLRLLENVRSLLDQMAASAPAGAKNQKAGWGGVAGVGFRDRLS